MHKRLETYLAKQCSVFLATYDLTLSSFDHDAIHDLRVAIKRIRTVFMLLEQMFPDQFKTGKAEGDLRELFRLSGRMRDAQVQQQLVSAYAETLNSSFEEYLNYLKNAEEKAISKFTKRLKGYQAEKDLDAKQDRVVTLLASADCDALRKHIILLVNDLLNNVRNIQADAAHDEHLHEIRRKLKQCHYLLSIFKKDDVALLHLHATLETLDKANDLLGDWHDRLVAMETLEQFFKKHKKNKLRGENRYRLFSEKLAEERHLLHMKILWLFESELKI